MLSSLVQALRPVNYSHARHHPQIQFICRDVYGGHDYLPAQLLKYSMDSEKAVVMLEDPQQQEGNLLGVGAASGLLCSFRCLRESIYSTTRDSFPVKHFSSLRIRIQWPAISASSGAATERSKLLQRRAPISCRRRAIPSAYRVLMYLVPCWRSVHRAAT